MEHSSHTSPTSHKIKRSMRIFGVSHSFCLKQSPSQNWKWMSLLLENCLPSEAYVIICTGHDKQTNRKRSALSHSFIVNDKSAQGKGV